LHFWRSRWLLAGAVHGQQAPGTRPSTGAAGTGPGIYSCTDAKGRTITADRPIADCIDREQRELNPSGTTRRKIEPTYTAREQAEREERERQAQLLAAPPARGKAARAGAADPLSHAPGTRSRARSRRWSRSTW